MARMFLLFGFFLSLVVALDKASSPVKDFMNGFEIGINKSPSCSENWKECGTYTGQLMKIPISDLISFFRREIHFSDALEVIEGFQTSFSSIWGCISTVIDVGAVAFDIYHFTTPGFQNENTLEMVSDVLNFSCSVQKTAFDFVFIMNTCGAGANLSLENVISNYYNHQDQVSSLIAYAKNCETNYRQCGKSVGDLIQLLLK
ncbi:unnamed protein product [Blepharisma stoltei]|uniref:Uncharacterized protein n=1 Tax=Blepharisma stoltei TaxID=1481888 RepID=A0AAU9IQ01_9CILI|nr:unnamed protein product [Blepharisma stoltei]